ncbi:Stage II sporulation protein E [bioreactor metagenome]|uniref:Stage II sporulation protein E n=1 Tax=bioreactor metagenome TaxID=1076179 RepID=A0A645DCU7_9ZZZZ
MELPKGGYMIALSDGMGSGKAAGEESRTVIELLEQFAEAGFKRELALKMINSVLVMGADEETFATLDMCYIDLYSGTAEFIKTGAAATFVIRDGKAKAIRSSSLPIGMLKYFDMDRAEYKLHKNDIVIMLTDGAAEVIDRENMSAQILTDLIAENSMKDPKDIAEYVLECLKEKSGFRIQDDMTVVAARIWG